VISTLAAPASSWAALARLGRVSEASNTAAKAARVCLVGRFIGGILVWREVHIRPDQADPATSLSQSNGGERRVKITPCGPESFAPPSWEGRAAPYLNCLPGMLARTEDGPEKRVVGEAAGRTVS
jgi:hypothetical protein